MELSQLSKKELLEILNNITSIIKGSEVNKSKTKNASKAGELESLIGTIPSFLLNQDIFEKNQDIAEFAKKLDVNIPSPEKKNREDIIGRIVSAISKFDKQKITDLNLAIQELKKTDLKKGKNNFFIDWENAIREMNL